MKKKNKTKLQLQKEIKELSLKLAKYEESGAASMRSGENASETVSSLAVSEAVENRLPSLEKAVESMNIGLTFTGLDGKIIYINPADADIHGYKREELIGRDARTLAPQDNHRVMSPEEIMKRKFWRRESVNVRKDGSLFPVNLNSEVVKDESGKPLMIVTTCEDITERKDMEAKLRDAKRGAEAANNAKSRFLAHMSHEIRTPMTSIISTVEFLSDSPLNEDQKDYVRILSGASENLLALISDILDLSKIEAGHLELQKVEFGLEELLFETVSFMGVSARGKGLELSYHVEPEIPVKFIGDPTRLRQIIFNIASNALKFTKEGRIDINVRKRETKDDITELEFSIKDTGIGIPEDKLDIIFKRFTQADSSTTRKFGGTGLGTAISKSLAEAMGGSIWAESELGKGSTFHFTVKLETAKTAKKGKGTKEKEAIHWERPLKILVAEDSRENLDIILIHLKKTPHLVDTAENGKVAVEKFQSGDYDLVLMDMEMPVMDGYTASKEIRKWEAANKKRPTSIVALTAHALKEHEQKSMDAGCTAYFTKPFRKQAFLETVYKYGSRPS